MVRHLFALAALLIATSGRLFAEGPLEDLALEIVARELGAPVNARHEAGLRLRAATDPPVEAVWRVGSVHLRPVAGASWPDHAGRDRYRVRGCEAVRVAQARPSPLAAIALPRPVVAQPARAVTRRLTLVFGPGSLLAVEAAPRAGGGHGFAGRHVLDAELWSELVRGAETLPGREPEGTLGRLVPRPGARTAEVEGRILGLGGIGPGSACPRLRLRAWTHGSRWVTVQQCLLEDLRGGC